MSKPKSISAYPAFYMTLADEFQAGARSKTITYPSQLEQQRARLDLYGFIRALREDGGKESHPDFVWTRIFASGERPWTLTLKHPDETYKGVVAK